MRVLMDLFCPFNSQVVVRVRHVGAVPERHLERRLRLPQTPPLGEHVGQISVGWKKVALL